MDVFQVEERGFYVRLVCNKGGGVALSLYKALESLTDFIVQSSNLATVSERFVLTFTLNVCFLLSIIFHFLLLLLLLLLHYLFSFFTTSSCLLM